MPGNGPVAFQAPKRSFIQETFAMSGEEANWKWFNWAWDNRKELRRYLNQLYRWFRGESKGNRPSTRGILILGAGGVGKTTLARLLAGQYHQLAQTLGKFEEDLAIEKYALSDHPEIEIVVPPGQHHRRDASWSDLLRRVASGEFRGVVLLSAYGYHSIGERSYKTLPQYHGKKEEFLEQYFDDKRHDEFKIISDLVPRLKENSAKLWLVSLIAKEDLWHRKHLAVEQHYRAGAYATEIQKISKRKEPRLFRHEYVFASLVISNFTTGKGERLQPNAEGYDQALQLESLGRVLGTFHSLLHWEAEP